MNSSIDLFSLTNYRVFVVLSPKIGSYFYCLTAKLLEISLL